MTWHPLLLANTGSFNSIRNVPGYSDERLWLYANWPERSIFCAMPLWWDMLR